MHGRNVRRDTAAVSDVRAWCECQSAARPAVFPLSSYPPTPSPPRPPLPEHRLSSDVLVCVQQRRLWKNHMVLRIAQI